MNKSRGNLYVVCAPSGTGKTTLVKALTDIVLNLTVSISHTTRNKRPSENHGVNYYFINETEFNRMIEQNEFLEHARVFNNFYGTSRKWVEETLSKGKDVILEIDWQGARQIQKLFPECISIFILPPSPVILEKRLRARNQDSPDVIVQRLADVRESASHISEFDYVVLNDDFDVAVRELRTIIEAGRLLTQRQMNKWHDLIAELGSFEGTS